MMRSGGQYDNMSPNNKNWGIKLGNWGIVFLGNWGIDFLGNWGIGELTSAVTRAVIVAQTGFARSALVEVELTPRLCHVGGLGGGHTGGLTRGQSRGLRRGLSRGLSGGLRGGQGAGLRRGLARGLARGLS
jgi:hypothetical protein